MSIALTKDGAPLPYTKLAIVADGLVLDLTGADGQINLHTPVVDPPPDPPPVVHPDDPTKEAEHKAVMALLPASEANGTTKRLVAPNDILAILSGETICDWIRVEGTLKITGGTLRVGTIVVMPTGRLEFTGGTVEFFGQVSDPFAFGVGLISHGSAKVVGAPKVPYTFTSALAPGQIQIPVAVFGWEVGDMVVIAGTSVDYRVNQDEVRTIAAVDATSVTLNAPLAFAHNIIDNHLPVVINLTRGVTFRTAEGSPDRGHVMFMHNPDIYVGFAAFVDLGRTDKTKLVTTPDGKGAGLENPNGRYALHFHRTGSNGSTREVGVVDVAIDGSPGWGLVNHESNVNVLDTVAYNVVGSAFVTETGRERGTFTRCVALRGSGNNGQVPSGQILSEGLNKLTDFARDGIGFWLEGGYVSVVDCFSIGQNAAGIFANSQPTAERHGLPVKDLTPAEIARLEATSLNFLRYREKPWTLATAPLDIRGNFVYGSHAPIHFWGISNAWASPQWTNQVVGNTFIQGGKDLPGVVLGYSRRLEFRDNRVLGNGSWTGVGFTHTGVSSEMRYINNTVVGFNIGISMPTEDSQSGGISDFGKYTHPNLIEQGFYDNLRANLFIANTQANYRRTIEIVNPTFGERATWNVEMAIEFFSFDLKWFYGGQSNSHDIEPLFRAEFLNFQQVAIGPASIVGLNGVPLFFEEQGADFAFGKRLVNAPEELRKNSDGSLTTTADLAARMPARIVGGVPLPAGVQSHSPKVRGVLVGA